MAPRRPPGLLVPLLLAALPLRAQAPAAAREIDELVAWLTGTFDSKEQAGVDADYQIVRMVTVAVPKSRLSFGAPVLYREQTTPEGAERPYLQRFMRFEQDPGGAILVRLFELKDPVTAAGKWRDASDLALFGKNDVRERDGCLVTLRPAGDRFEGGTSGRRCVSSLRGAAYATSEVRIWKDRLETWDRGYDGDGKQVWGPVKGPYHFVKRSTGIPADAVPGAGQPPTPRVVATPAPAPPSKVDAAPLPGRPHETDIVLLGLGRREVVSSAVLRTDTTSTTARADADGGTYRGVPLAAVLFVRGIRTEGEAARRLLASAVLVASGADGLVSVFSAEEIFASRDSFLLAVERDGKPLGPEGPVLLLDARSPSRTVRRLQLLEWRVLAATPPGSANP